MTAYYNDNDRYVAQWLRNLIAAGHLPAGEVDERSIADIRPDDLRGFIQCHFFAGIGGWPLALKLAGWPDDQAVWTGSCPCQPLSSAGQRRGHADERHIWPAFHRLIAECRPATVFGEQVASKDGREWLAGVRADLEQLGYAVGAADLPAAGVGAPHIRQRLWWVADAASERERSGKPRSDSISGQFVARAEAWRDGGHDGSIGALADAGGRLASDGGIQRGGQHGQQQENGGAGALGQSKSGRWRPLLTGERQALPATGRASEAGELAVAAERRWGSRGTNNAGQRPSCAQANGSGWIGSELVNCTDGKARRTQPGIHPLAHGIPGRVGRLRAYGNAIVPQVAAEFVSAFMEAA